MLHGILLKSALRQERNRLYADNLNHFAEKAKHTLFLLGISPKTKGYYFILYALEIYCALDIKPGTIKITKDIYPLLAELFKTSPSTIERNIRYTILQLCDKDKTPLYNHLFGTFVNFGSVPTNALFLSTVSMHIKDKCHNTIN